MNPLLIEKWKSYLIAQARSSPPRPAAALRAVTISRQTGAGSSMVARLLADYLEEHQAPPCSGPWAVFDRELVKAVLADHALPEEVERYMAEDAGRQLDDVLEELFGLHPPSWTLAQHTNHTIQRLAGRGNVILVGRGSHIVTSALRHVFHVRLIAPLEVRIRHVQDHFRLNPKEAAAFIRRGDAAKARYIRRNFEAKVNDPLRFHITINTGRMSFETAARMIGEAVLHGSYSQ